MERNKFRGFVPVIILFGILNAIFIAGRKRLEEWNVDQEVLLAGNALLFIITFLSFAIALKGLRNPNPNVFMRSVMGSIMIKMFLLVIAAFIYISINKGELNKPALFACMGLYLVYTFMEVAGLMKLLKKTNNG